MKNHEEALCERLAIAIEETGRLTPTVKRRWTEMNLDKADDSVHCGTIGLLKGVRLDSSARRVRSRELPFAEIGELSYRLTGDLLQLKLISQRDLEMDTDEIDTDEIEDDIDVDIDGWLIWQSGEVPYQIHSLALQCWKILLEKLWEIAKRFPTDNPKWVWPRSDERDDEAEYDGGNSPG